VAEAVTFGCFSVPVDHQGAYAFPGSLIACLARSPAQREQFHAN